MAVSFGALEPGGPTPEEPGWDTPFKIAIFGDFTGRTGTDRIESADDLRARKPKKINRENFDEVLASWEVNLKLNLPDGTDVEVPIQALDDFFPDHFLDKVDKYSDLDNDERGPFLSSLLHHPTFQAVESAWRGLDWLLKRACKTDNGVEVVLYDVAYEEFKSDLNASETLNESVLYHWLIEKSFQGHNSQPWGVWLGLYQLPMNEEGVQVLGRMSRLARHAGTPFLAGVEGKIWDPKFKLDGDDAEAWKSLRELPDSNLLGLAGPRFLLRAPYGSGTKSLDKFDYEEFTGPENFPYLWGHAGLGCAMLLARSFVKKNWNMKPGTELELDNLALHVYRVDGEEEVTLAEAWLSKPVNEKIIKLGIMPILCVRGQNAAQFLRIMSVAQPAKDQPACDLLGTWGQKALKGLPKTPTKPAIGISVGMGSDVKSVRAVKSMQEPEFLAPESTRAVPSASDLMGESASSSSFSSSGGSGYPETTDDFLAALERIDAGESEGGENDDEVSGDSGDSDFEMPSGDEEPSEQPEASSDEMDPELAALMASMGGGDSSESEAPAADSEMDPELAAMMAELESAGGGAPAAEPAAEEEMDPELAAMLAELEGGGDAAPAAEEPAAEEEMDPELAKMLADLEAGEETAADETPAAEEEAMDPELAAMLAELEANEPAAEPEPEPEAEPEEEMDPELAAMLKELEG